jgi:hypothetical protein
MESAHGTLASARNLAVKRQNGRKLTDQEKAQVNYWVEIVGPENFYMDGELFA